MTELIKSIIAVIIVLFVTCGMAYSAYQVGKESGYKEGIEDYMIGNITECQNQMITQLDNFKEEYSALKQKCGGI